jgi:predicted TIM-barrel fold metal-dependent hydrolase
VSVFDEPKIDTHCHVLDPARFPYAPDVAYRPAGQEAGALAQYLQVMDAYGIRHALLVGPNSGYGLDNRCLLDAVRQGDGRFRGIAVVNNDIQRRDLLALREAGVIGVAFNATVLGLDYYAGAAPLLRMLADLDMLVSVQVEHDQMVALRPMLEASGVRVLVDHGGRPKASRRCWPWRAAAAWPSSCRACRSSRGSRHPMPTPAPSCARWSTRSRPTPACGHRTGRS